MKRVLNWLILLCLLLSLCACLRSKGQGEEVEHFIPPTLVATAVHTPTMDPFTPIPVSVDVNCENNLSYLDDVTVPDGTVFEPGAEIIKTWSVQNSGTCSWNSRYSLRIVTGDSMSASPRQELTKIEPDESGEVSVTFTAPDTMGSYYSSWRAYDDQGRAFGDDIYIEIIVSVAAQY